MLFGSRLYVGVGAGVPVGFALLADADAVPDAATVAVAVAVAAVSDVAVAVAVVSLGTGVAAVSSGGSCASFADFGALSAGGSELHAVASVTVVTAARKAMRAARESTAPSPTRG